MRKSILVSSLILAAGIAFGAQAQPQQKAAVMSEPGKVGVAQTVEVTAKIKAIDAATRTVTLQGARGEVDVVAGPEVKNFAQLKVGDTVGVKYAEALVLELKKGGGMPVARTEQGGVASAKPGAKPGAVGANQVSVVSDVIATDPATQMITVKGPKRTLDLKVRDPEQFKLIAKGDQIQATYTEAVAIAVTPAKGK